MWYDLHMLLEFVKMRLVKYERLFNRINFTLLGVKLHFRLPTYKKNFYVSLGQNCFSRMKLTTYGLKAKKKQGELSCPFDLSNMPVDSIAKILNSNFKDYFVNLYYDEVDEMWKNSRYLIQYPHDYNLFLPDMMLRYQKRIDNFQNMVANQKKLVFVLTTFDRNFEIESLNQIYEYLKLNRKEHCFKFFVISFVDENSPAKNIRNICKDIIYKEYEPLTPLFDFEQTWHNSNENESVVISVLHDIENLSRF